MSCYAYLVISDWLYFRLRSRDVDLERGLGVASTYTDNPNISEWSNQDSSKSTNDQVRLPISAPDQGSLDYPEATQPSNSGVRSSSYPASKDARPCLASDKSHLLTLYK